MNDLAKLLAISFDPDVTHEYQRAPLYCASPRGARIRASSGGDRRDDVIISWVVR